MRIRWVDVAKGLGLYIVILGHQVTNGSMVFSWIFSFHMPLFFFLAGYVFKLEPSVPVTDSIVSVANSLLLPYLFFVAIGFAVSFVVPGWWPTSLKVTVIEVFWNVQPESLHVGQIWFLFTLAITQLLFLFVKLLRVRNRTTEALVVVGIGVLALVISEFSVKVSIRGMSLRLPLKLDTACMALVFFYFGNVTSSYKELLAKRSKLLRGVIGGVGGLLVSIAFGPLLNGTVNMAENAYNNPLYFIISATAGVYVVVAVSLAINASVAIEYFGSNSLSMFSMHSLLLYLFEFAASAVFSHEYQLMKNMPGWLCLLGSIFVCLLLLPVPIFYKRSYGAMVFLWKRKNIASV